MAHKEGPKGGKAGESLPGLAEGFFHLPGKGERMGLMQEREHSGSDFEDQSGHGELGLSGQGKTEEAADQGRGGQVGGVWKWPGLRSESDNEKEETGIRNKETQ